MASRSESAFDAACRVLRHRERSTTEVRDRLEAAGYSRSESEEAIESLLRTGLLDDGRFAELRARSLAGGGAGDNRIRHELHRAGIRAEIVEEALGSIEPEADRARQVISRRGSGSKTARFLHGKGFSEEVVGSVVAGGLEEELG